MNYSLGNRIFQRQMTRRDFLWLLGVSGGGAALSQLGGCAANPVTGQRQLMLMSEAQEIQIDQEQAPHQFSDDFGAVQDNALNHYVAQLGNSLAQRSHRPQMPYSYRVVNANYVNAYAFPGGSIATTRGILLELDNEAELAALLGHEIGHVNARHAAARMSQGLLGGALLAGVSAYVGSEYESAAPWVEMIGAVGSGALLAHYSRDNEREADRLGMEYMTRAGQNPQGMVGLMEVLMEQSQHKPSALEQMFSSHPMSSERYETAKSAAQSYAASSATNLNRERYMDNTARLRRLKPAVTEMQSAEREMNAENFDQADPHLRKALQLAPNDYVGLVLMAKNLIARNQPREAEAFAEKAKQIYPQEAQAQHVAGISQLAQNRFSAAYQNFARYEQRLPGNPNTVFLQAVSLEGMRDKPRAASAYARYLQMNRSGAQAQHAQQRLSAWGYAR